MVLDTSNPPTERIEDFVVAGVAHRGTDVDEGALWRELDDYAGEDLAEAAVGDDRYAVMFDVDEGSGEFTYVAGREVSATADLAPELTAVRIPDATYAVLTPSTETISEMVAEIHEAERFDDADDGDEAHSPIFERYAVGETPLSAERREIFVPVRED
jgi:predicted transcriptional regulator YdeE